MRSRATCGGTPKTAATAAEVAALALLARPGSWRWIGQAEPCGSRTWSPDSAQLGRRAAEAALAAEPVVAGALHHTAAGRAGPGVVLPHLAGGDPDHVGGGGGGPDDQRVVGVGDDDGLGTGEPLAPVLGEHPGLGGAVELVAGEVEQRDALRVGVPGDAGEVLLVDLDDAELGVRAARERRGDAGGHVGAERVGHDRARGAQGLRDQPGGRGLAVGRRDQDHVQVLGEPGEQVGVEFERHPAADHRSAAASGGARDRRDRLARRHGQLGPRRQRVRVACHRFSILLAYAPRLCLRHTW